MHFKSIYKIKSMRVFMKKEKIFKIIEDSINSLDTGDAEKKELFEGLLRLKKNKVNLMVTGATGCGKSSTINAMFNADVAKVGVGADPETLRIEKYEFDNLFIWDTPGLGDGKENDRIHSKAIIKKLNELDEENNPLIDLVLVILDGGSRDLGTSYELINQVIIPNLGENAKDRILVAINQADVAMKGRNWDYENNQPMPKLIDFLNEKADSVQRRIEGTTGLKIEPIYYSAGYKEDGEEQRPWNLSKLFYFIVKNTKEEKRIAYLPNLSADKTVWQDDDKLIDYREETQKSFAETATRLSRNVAAGAAAGAAFGSLIPVVGTTIGGIAGGIIGGVFSLFS